VTENEIKSLMQALAPIFADFVRQAIAPLRERIKQLEDRPAIQYRGVFEIGRAYSEGDFVTDKGAIWRPRFPF
jgi:hypothetical protein